jgi:lipopolysaccharide/colanic/teichoic acid biosynthesis glycosyltransferase
MSLIRFFDFLFALIGIIILSPLFIIVSILIKLDSKGAIIYKQIRVGKNNIDFGLYKFRTMKVDSDKKGLLTVGGKDARVTRIGFLLRKFKMDELPQLFNVLFGNMSLVGPRPEVRKYVELYTTEQLKILSVLPGITDLASITYRNENDLLAAAENPEKFYIDEVMPHKLNLNLEYIENRSIQQYFRIILKTIFVSLKG